VGLWNTHTLLWSVKGDKITPTEHYVTPERRAYLKTLCGDDKNFGSESYGVKLPHMPCSGPCRVTRRSIM